MTLKGKMVHPDKRKGLVYVYQSDDSLMHFCWKDRTKGTVEDDLIIFPDDIEFKHVTQCTTGRVYLLKFKSSSRKFFFWMQEPKTDKDDEYRRKVNDLLNNPPTPGSSRGGSGGFSGIPPELVSAEGDLQSLLGNMNQQQLMQLLGGMGMSNMGGLSQLIGGGRPSSSQSDSTSSSRAQSSPGPRSTESTASTPAATTAASVTVPAAPLATASSTPAPTVTTAAATPAATPAVAGGSSGILLSDLQNILGSLGAPAEPKEPIDLATAITPESMIPLLANSEVQERLMPFLPEGEVLPKTAEELRSTVSSPQFRQAMSSFSAALASGQLGPLMPQFGLGEDVANAAAQGDVEAFVKAMQAKKEDSSAEKKE